MNEKSQHEQIADARRDHNRKLDQLRSEYAPTRDIDEEYQAHQQRISAILGDDDLPCVGSAGGPTT